MTIFVTQNSWKVHVNLNPNAKSKCDVIISGLEVTATVEVEEEEDWD